MPVIRYIKKLGHNIVPDQQGKYCRRSISFNYIISILFCRLINVDILLLFLTMYIQLTEMFDNVHIEIPIHAHVQRDKEGDLTQSYDKNP